MLQYAIDGIAPAISGRESLLWDEAEEQIDKQRDSYTRQQAPNVTRRDEALRRRDEGVTPRNDGVEKSSPLSSPTPPSITPLKERKKTSPKGEEKERALSPALAEAVQAFKEMRVRIRKPMTHTAVELMLKRLEKMAPGDEEKQIAILMQSVENSWTGVWEVKEPEKKQEKARKNNTLLNYQEKGVSHANLNDIKMDLEEL